MKKTILLIVACTFAFISAFAQNSEVETINQLTKAEMFKTENSLIKEAEIYKATEGSMKMYAKLFTDLKTGEQLAALEFHPSTGLKILTGGIVQPLGYLDMDKVDDLILALEKMLEEHNNAGKKDNFTISYTAPGGIDAYFATDFPGQPTSVVIFRKKWYSINEYGTRTCNYSDGLIMVSVKFLPKLIAEIKEAQIIANQALGK